MEDQKELYIPSRLCKQEEGSFWERWESEANISSLGEALHGIFVLFLYEPGIFFLFPYVSSM